MNRLLALFQIGHPSPGSADSIVRLGWPQFAILMSIVLVIALVAGFAGLAW